MNEIPRGWAVVPKAAWVVAVLMALGTLLLLLLLVPVSGRASMSEALWIFTIVAAPLVAGGMVLAYGFVYGDAKRRGMRAVLWLLLCLFIPNAIGFILYFVLRDPLPLPCPECATMVSVKFAYCPSCGAQVTPGCKNCGNKLEPGRSNCPHCGTKLGGI